MTYTNLEIAIILDTCKTEDDVKKTSFWLRALMRYEKSFESLEFLRIASLEKLIKVIKC